ncbi:MAG: class I SAM-dependent methyltransferase, partial [Solirubrobacterales bacterium]|nr:class I SAM-dependent methyltransferase [Solirubrobacterales bacterium]
LSLHEGTTVLDVGAGTGKLSRALVPSGAEVVAVEPVAAMREVLARELSAVRVLDGTAEALPLGDQSADAVVVGQAFHWFDGEAALREFDRVLRPAGRLGLIWNRRRLEQPVQRAIDEIIEPYRQGTPSLGSGAWRGALDRSALFAPAGELKVSFEQRLDADQFVDRIASISFIAALERGERDGVLSRIRELAGRHPERLAYDSEVYVFQRG